MTPGEALNAALVDLADQRRRPRCSEPGDRDLWTSDEPGDRARAARLCHGCEVLDQCRAAADALDERHHVWAGVDRTIPFNRKKTNGA